RAVDHRVSEAAPHPRAAAPADQPPAADRRVGAAPIEVELLVGQPVLAADHCAAVGAVARELVVAHSVSSRVLLSPFFGLLVLPFDFLSPAISSGKPPLSQHPSSSSSESGLMSRYIFWPGV